MRQGLSPCSWRHTVAVVISYQMRKLDSTATAASDSMATMKAAFVLWTCHHRLSASLSLPLSVYLLLSLYVSLSFCRGCCWQYANKICKAQKLIKLNQICFRHFSSTIFLSLSLSLLLPLSLYCLVSIFQFFECLSRQQFQIFLGNWIAVVRSSVSTTCNSRRGEARLINNAHSTRN